MQNYLEEWMYTVENFQEKEPLAMKIFTPSGRSNPTNLCIDQINQAFIEGNYIELVFWRKGE